MSSKKLGRKEREAVEGEPAPVTGEQPEAEKPSWGSRINSWIVTGGIGLAKFVLYRSDNDKKAWSKRQTNAWNASFLFRAVAAVAIAAVAIAASAVVGVVRGIWTCLKDGIWGGLKTMWNGAKLIGGGIKALATTSRDENGNIISRKQALSMIGLGVGKVLGGGIKVGLGAAGIAAIGFVTVATAGAAAGIPAVVATVSQIPLVGGVIGGAIASSGPVATTSAALLGAAKTVALGYTVPAGLAATYGTGVTVAAVTAGTAVAAGVGRVFRLGEASDKIGGVQVIRGGIGGFLKEVGDFFKDVGKSYDNAVNKAENYARYGNTVGPKGPKQGEATLSAVARSPSQLIPGGQAQLVSAQPGQVQPGNVAPVGPAQPSMLVSSSLPAGPPEGQQLSSMQVVQGPLEGSMPAAVGSDSGATSHELGEGVIAEGLPSLPLTVTGNLGEGVSPSPHADQLVNLQRDYDEMALGTEGMSVVEPPPGVHLAGFTPSANARLDPSLPLPPPDYPGVELQAQKPNKFPTEEQCALIQKAIGPAHLECDQMTTISFAGVDPIKAATAAATVPGVGEILSSQAFRLVVPEETTEEQARQFYLAIFKAKQDNIQITEVQAGKYGDVEPVRVEGNTVKIGEEGQEVVATIDGDKVTVKKPEPKEGTKLTIV